VIFESVAVDDDGNLLFPTGEKDVCGSVDL
jgi:hypothetical protein